MNTVKLAVVQMSMSGNSSENLDRACELVLEAANAEANIVLLPEFFEHIYFPQQQDEAHFSIADTVEESAAIRKLQLLAKENNVVLPVSFFERANQAYFNSMAMIDSDGTILGVYRKSHIPDGPGYQEKFYFNPGDTGFKVWKTRFGNIGVGICWDQWFPEAARCMALQNADLLLYPTAIGSEPYDSPVTDTKEMWQRAMIGHAVSNSIYLAAANRIGIESDITFYGSSFICDYTGEKLSEAGRNEDTILFSNLNFEASKKFRAGFGFFRDRRPQLYGAIKSLDGVL